MKVLEIGCGTGHMAVELAKVIGDHGIVVATDFSEAQLVIAKETAREAGVHNIEFVHLDLKHDLVHYLDKFDFTYGRWVIEFTQNNAEKVFEQWFKSLRLGGVLVYESIDLNDCGVFTYPDLEISNLYAEIGKKMFIANQMPTDFIKRAYFLLKNLKADAMNMAPNQAILKTPEEKSVMRLGMLAAEAFLKTEVFSPEEFNRVIKIYEKFEQSNNIAGFYRNYLVSGKKV